MPKKDNTPATFKFKVVGVQPGLILFQNKHVDLSTATDEELGHLHDQGCPYVAPVDEEPVI